MEERRKLSRIDYKVKGVIVVCDTEEKITVDVKDVSPLGMGVLMKKGSPAILGKDVIIVASVSCIYGIGEVDDYKNKMLIKARESQ